MLQEKIYTPLHKLLLASCLVLSIVHIMNIWIIFPSHILRSLHLALLFPIIYLKLNKEQDEKMLSLALKIFKVLVGFGACMYYGLNYDALVDRGTAPNPVDIAVGFALILIVTDAAARSVGMGMAAVTVIFLLYVFFGQHLPGIMGHGGYSVRRIIGHIFISSNGIFGSMLQMSATYIALFTILGSFLEGCGASDAFINLAVKATGKLAGGPALAAVIASCLFGMVNGSAVVNVITTGTFTIPMMKGIGIAPHVAGAVEAAASTGGQLMPPVMGAGAFVMADITGIPYSSIVVRAIIPALVYFIGVFAGVFFYVKRKNIPTVDPSIIPPVSAILKSIHLLAPMGVVLVMILLKYSPMYSACYGILTAATLVLFNEFKNFRVLLTKLNESLINGSLNLASVAMGLACAGIIIGAITLTGLGAKFVSLVIIISGGYPLLALFFVAVAVLILGMGLPTSAAYVITATMAVPALIGMKFELLACHLFVFYFAVIAPVTPPVAIAAYAASGIASSSPTKTGYMAFIFAVPAFLMPFLFMYNPLLLAVGDFGDIVWAYVTAVVGAVSLAAALQGYLLSDLSLWQRALLLIGALCLIIPGVVSDSIGLALLILIGFMSRRRKVISA